MIPFFLLCRVPFVFVGRSVSYERCFFFTDNSSVSGKKQNEAGVERCCRVSFFLIVFSNTPSVACDSLSLFFGVLYLIGLSKPWN